MTSFHTVSKNVVSGRGNKFEKIARARSWFRFCSRFGTGVALGTTSARDRALIDIGRADIQCFELVVSK